ncbi:sigma-70 family RNA polymerase sigma factor [Hymenobacter gummosus]|uniref:sigma-70 family RNA polymerase sigma factor n=1 Tax=Hymenobacter gummosus TaxID=1776032 RepID=UPI001404A1BB|nr:sigma-70 family RNA polymerase sigma factor [Hymenobacter gummosus]
MPPSTDLPDLLARCLWHEPAAQRALYARYAGKMLSVARRYARSQAEAEDILQDAFVKVFTRLAEFRGEGSLEGWVRRIVVTTAINHWQSGKLRRQQLQLDEVSEPATLAADSLERLSVAEVLALIERQPDGSRPGLLLCAIDGYTHAEISEMLGIQESTSKAQLSKARKQLLQLGSLQLIAQSHNCTWMLSHTGVLTMCFADAKLPPRSINVIASQGFVRFRVLPMSTLQPGAIIPSCAHITFDYNDPLRTNTATTTVLLPTASRPGQLATAWSAYPNPATEQLTVTAELPADTPVTVKLRDALGRLVREQQQVVPADGLRQTLDVRALPAGLYHLQLRTAAGLLGSRGILRQ